MLLSFVSRFFQYPRLHGYSCNRNRYANFETNPNVDILTKLFYNTNSSPERWRFAYDKLGVCLRETTTLVLANLLFLYFKLDPFKMLIVNLLYSDGDLFGVFEITLQT